MKTRTDSPGFTYIIEYIGENEELKGKKYAGCSTWKKGWESYKGSPSKKNDATVGLWKHLTKIEPHNFKQTIIKELQHNENLIEEEVKLLTSVSNDIQNDKQWLNSCVPRKNGFPIYKPTAEEKKLTHQKRILTNIQKYGIPYLVLDMEKRRESCLSRYGVDHHNKTQINKKVISKHRKEYFSSLTPSQLKEHGSRSLLGRDMENVLSGIEKGKITKQNKSKEEKDKIEQARYEKWCKRYYTRTDSDIKETSQRCAAASQKRLQYYITFKYNDTGEMQSDFLKNMCNYNFALDGIISRIKSDNVSKPLYSRTAKRWITILDVIRKPDFQEA